ncbi:hypothetical protein DPMN_027433 [Dreissena polymorpha]|uniref:Uncharacterized protein n=1 Tax=Dreissena polymorpha TaxID=45954 RepID=A0A9D4LUC3_DREPO|nr:hypothetical protein DPMN_027433 [Dreissena polymorpha]
MYAILALIACLGVSLAAQCCVPPQWTSQASFLTTVVRNGKPYYNRGTLLMAYDAVRHRIGQYEHVELNSAANTLDIGVLLDFTANRKWVINSKTGKCYTMPLNRKLDDFIGCVSENATLVGSQDSVGFAPNVLRLNTYSMDGPGLREYASFTSDACVPVGDTVRGTIDGSECSPLLRELSAFDWFRV